MITTDELKVQLADYGTAVKDLEEALAIDASRKRVQELEHTMSRPGFYDDAELSKKVFDEVGDLKGKLTRFEKLQGLYDDAETMLVMLDEEYDPEMVPEAEEAVKEVGFDGVALFRPSLLLGDRAESRPAERAAVVASGLFSWAMAGPLARWKPVEAEAVAAAMLAVAAGPLQGVRVVENDEIHRLSSGAAAPVE